MERKLAELDALDRAHGLGAVGRTTSARRRMPRPRTRLVLESLFALSMCGSIFILSLVLPPHPPRDEQVAASSSASLEEPLSDAPRDRLRPAVPVVSAGAHAFMTVSPTGEPVTFDPCRPIRWVVNPAGVTSGGLEQLRAAIREIGDATGLQLVEDGVTSERLVENREGVQPDRYGPGWAPVLIGWVDEAEFPLVGGDVVGVARSVTAAPAGSDAYRYVSGLVALDRTWFAQAASDPGSALEARITILHELGHLVGLDHVVDNGEVMGESTEATQLGPGDLQGLAIVGSGRCGNGG